jgi:hypothetical protein
MVINRFEVYLVNLAMRGSRTNDRQCPSTPRVKPIAGPHLAAWIGISPVVPV